MKDYDLSFRGEILQVDSGLLAPANKLYYFINGLKVDLRPYVDPQPCHLRRGSAHCASRGQRPDLRLSR